MVIIIKMLFRVKRYLMMRMATSDGRHMPSGWPLLVMAAGVIIQGTAAVATEAVVDVPPDGKTKVSVAGRAIDAFSGPGMPSILSLRRSVALDMFGAESEVQQERSSKRFKIISVSANPDAKVGPVLVKGFFFKADVAVGGQATNGTVKWSMSDAYGFADALAGPYAIPGPIVRYTLRKATGTERTGSLRLLPVGAWWVASTDMQIGGKWIRFAFAPHFPTSVASAAAASVISAEFGGSMSGSTQRTLISHGVDRPTRMMRLDRPVSLGPVNVDRLLVRTADYGSAGSIPDNDIDPSEMSGDIIVNGRRSASRPSYVVYVGADALQGCASITYDKRRHRIDLACT